MNATPRSTRAAETRTYYRIFTTMACATVPLGVINAVIPSPDRLFFVILAVAVFTVSVIGAVAHMRLYKRLQANPFVFQAHPAKPSQAEALAAIRALHVPDPRCSDAHDGAPCCEDCEQKWPCPTHRIASDVLRAMEVTR